MNFFILLLSLAVLATAHVDSSSDDSTFYYFSNSVFNTWGNTLRTCKALAEDGNLIKIDLQEKNDLLIEQSGRFFFLPSRKILFPMFYILADQFLNGETSLSFWIGLKWVPRKQAFYWTDGTPLRKEDYQYWASINPGQIEENRPNCVAINLYTNISTNSSADVRHFQTVIYINLLLNRFSKDDGTSMTAKLPGLLFVKLKANRWEMFRLNNQLPFPK